MNTTATNPRTVNHPLNGKPTGALKKDVHGFNVRAHRYARVTREEVESLLKPEAGEEVYLSTVENGIRIGKPLRHAMGGTAVKPGEIAVKPGDTLSLGPAIVKAALPEPLSREVAELQRNGFGGVRSPEHSSHGWRIRIPDLLLPGGVRTDVLLLLPLNYPFVGPIGFYIAEKSPTGSLDLSHLFKNRVYHEAVDLSNEPQKWLWFCGIMQDWKPNRHTLLTYMTAVLSLLNERTAVSA
jgi:hypothetical protein